MKRLIFDCDPGIDDALAIMLAASSPELRLEAITTVAGNVPVQRATENALKILELLGVEDVPVAVGASKPLRRKLVTAEHFHGPDGLGGVSLPKPRLRPVETYAPDLIVESARRLSGELTIVATGPLTNVASALMREPELPKLVRELVIMGGAYSLTPYGYGNVTPVSEFNFYVDPDAARVVLEAGFRARAVGLDVTTDPRASVGPELHRKLKSMGRIGGVIHDMLRNPIRRFGVFNLHDPMAVAVLVEPSLFEFKPFRVYVETEGTFSRGQSIVERRPWVRVEPNLDVCVSVDGPGFLKLFLDRVVHGGGRG